MKWVLTISIKHVQHIPDGKVWEKRPVLPFIAKWQARKFAGGILVLHTWRSNPRPLSLKLDAWSLICLNCYCSLFEINHFLTYAMESSYVEVIPSFLATRVQASLALLSVLYKGKYTILWDISCPSFKALAKV